MDTKISLKLLVDGSAKKVLFAEAGKDFVDFLFGLLQVPLCALMTSLLEKSMADESKPLVNICNSVQSLDPSFYLQPSQAKSFLLRPIKPTSNIKHTPLLQQLAYTETQNVPVVNPPQQLGRRELFSSGGPSPCNQVEGYVKGMVSYMVMDDLKVKSMSTISSITLLNTFQVKDIGCLHETTVEVDMAKGLELVKASFESTTVLTDIFLGKECRAGETKAIANTWIDWKETPKAHVFKVDLPGLKKEDVKVEVEEERVLQISGERRREKEEENDKWHCVERSSGKFLRQFHLPEHAKMDGVKASMENGVLTVTVPKEEKKKVQAQAIDISG